MTTTATQSRRTFLKETALGLIAAGTLGATGCAKLIPNIETSKSKRRPNIIFMLADDLGYGDVGCYGCPDIRTPNMDRLAAEGVRFTDAYAAAPVCSPTRTAFVTGLYQQRLGNAFEEYMTYPAPGVDPTTHKTVAMRLKDQGYKTACYGKWNVGHTQETMPHRHGFDHWIGMCHNFDYFSHKSVDHKIGKYLGPLGLYENGEPKQIEGYITDVLGDLTVDYIENADANTPFFIYVPWQAPHGPMQPPDADPDELFPHQSPQPEDRPAYIKIVERLDYQIGRIMDALKRKGIDENTLVILSSDNGGCRAARNFPLKGRKQGLEEGGIRVPTLMRRPGQIPAGRVSAQPAITMDITATILAAAGIDIAQIDPLDGIDLLPHATGQKQPDLDRTLYWRRRVVRFGKDPINRIHARAIRQGDWKYHDAVHRKEEELYNLKDDIGETKNLIEQHPEITARLKKKLEAWEAEVTPPGPPLFSDKKT